MNKLTLPNEQAVRACIEEIYFRAVVLGKTKIEFHTFLQNKIAGLASKFSLTPEKEYVVPHFWGDSDGYIDVVWAVGSIPVVAIEIDSALREKSIKKLLVSNSNLLYWVYYGVAPYETLVKSIDLACRIKVIHYPSRFSKFGIKSESIKLAEIHKTELKSTRSYSVVDVRTKYPRAYEKWSDEQDKILKKSVQDGLAVGEIAKNLQRKPGAIRSRIRKLGLL